MRSEQVGSRGVGLKTLLRLFSPANESWRSCDPVLRWFFCLIVPKMFSKWILISFCVGVDLQPRMLIIFEEIFPPQYHS